MQKIVLITGATSGIGKACAEKFSAAGYAVIITGRRQERLDELTRSLQDAYHNKVLGLCFDVQDKKAVFTVIENLQPEWKKIDILINNAGLALGRDSFDSADLQDWETMIDTNVKGLLYVSKAVIPFMITNKAGHIINIGSIAGKEVYENGNVYCASKFAVGAVSQAQRIDLLKYNIKVTALHPGAVETEFSLVRYKGEASKAAATYNNFIPLTGADVADSIYYCCNLPAHVCINDLVITPTSQATAHYLHKNQ